MEQSSGWKQRRELDIFRMERSGDTHSRQGGVQDIPVGITYGGVLWIQ